MQFKRPKNTDKYYWTDHSVYKLMQYGLSAQRIIRIIRAPFRIEKGIVKDTIAVMQPPSFTRDKEGKKVWKQELWVMYQLRRNVGANSKSKILNSKQIQNSKIKNSKTQKLMKLKANEANQLKIISAWRYPGVSPKNNPIPEEILEEILRLAT